MTEAISDHQGRGVQGSRRSRGVRRRHRVEFALSDEEYEVLGAAAQRSGLARGAFAAEASMAAATGRAVVGDSGRRDALAELIRAAGLLRRIGVNLNQAVAKLNATGQRSGDLLPYAKECLRRAVRVDAAAEAVRKTLVTFRAMDSTTEHADDAPFREDLARNAEEDVR